MFRVVLVKFPHSRKEISAQIATVACSPPETVPVCEADDREGGVAGIDTPSTGMHTTMTTIATRRM